MTSPQLQLAARPPARRRKKRGWLRWLVGALIVMVALVGSFVAIETGAPSSPTLASLCGKLSLTRHGLPCDIPLPSDATFIGNESGMIPDGFPADEWSFKTSQSPSEILHVYSAGLGDEGWSCIQAEPLDNYQMFIAGIDKPDRPNTTLEVALESYGVGEYKLIVELIQAALPLGFSC